jgi:hypothetical protein
MYQITDQEVIDRFIAYQMTFVEQKSAWNNFRICPYAKKYREAGKVKYVPLRFTIDDCLADPFVQPLREFAAQDHHLALIYINPDPMNYRMLEDVIVKIAPVLSELNLEAHSGHPEHPLCVNGTYLRREPFATLQFISTRLSRLATRGLHRAGYYEGWGKSELVYIEFDKQFTENN